MTDTDRAINPERQRRTASARRYPHLGDGARRPGDLRRLLPDLHDLPRHGAAEFLAAQQHLDITIGVANTVVLLTSSWFVARGVLAARDGDHARAVRLTYLGGGFGVLFIAIKAYEWATKIVHGDTMHERTASSASTTCSPAYTCSTSPSVLLILGVVVRELRNPRRRRMSLVESGAIYWHMVDLLWIVIFALFYVMR